MTTQEKGFYQSGFVGNRSSDKYLRCWHIAIIDSSAVNNQREYHYE